MKEEDIDKRIERVIESVGSKKTAMRQWESDRMSREISHKVAAKRWRTYGISAAASVVVICGVGLGIFLNQDVGVGDGITYSAPVFRGGSCDISEIQAMIDSAQYDKALQAIDITLADTIIDPTFSSERQEYLRSLNVNQEYELTWLKIDALVKSNRTDDALALLIVYVNKEGVHQNEAKELLKKISR